MSIAGWIPKATNTHSEYVITYFFSSATMVARTRLNITFYYLGRIHTVVHKYTIFILYIPSKYNFL